MFYLAGLWSLLPKKLTAYQRNCGRRSVSATGDFYLWGCGVDPVSVALLAALAGGVGGEMGKQAWGGLSALVRRPFRHGSAAAEDVGVSAVSSGEAELVALEQAPADPTRGQLLSTALAVRSALDADFRTGLQQWHEQAKLVRTGDGDVHNSISGGYQYGTVVQGRDFSGLTFNSRVSPPGGHAPREDGPPAQG